MSAPTSRVVLYNRRYPMVPGLIVTERLLWSAVEGRNAWTNPNCLATATDALAEASAQNT